MINEILEFIEDKKIYSFAEFVSYCREKNEKWFGLLINHSSSRDMVKDFIESLRWELDSGYNRSDSILRTSGVYLK